MLTTVEQPERFPTVPIIMDGYDNSVRKPLFRVGIKTQAVILHQKTPISDEKGVFHSLEAAESYFLPAMINFAARRPISTAKFVPRSQG